jgi:hypothetical protein
MGIPVVGITNEAKKKDLQMWFGAQEPSRIDITWMVSTWLSAQNYHETAVCISSIAK